MHGLRSCVLAVACALVSCQACESEEMQGFSECVKVETLEGTRHDCETHSKYARCVAHLLEKKLAWCRYSGPIDASYLALEQDFFDVRRATPGEEAWIREQCPRRDLSLGVTEVSSTPDILICPDRRLAQCLAYQRAGSTFVCVAETAGLTEFGLLRRHKNTLRVDLGGSSSYQHRFSRTP